MKEYKNPGEKLVKEGNPLNKGYGEHARSATNQGKKPSWSTKKKKKKVHPKPSIIKRPARKRSP